MKQQSRGCPVKERFDLNFLLINAKTQVIGKATSRLGCYTQQSPEIVVIQQLFGGMCQQTSYVLKPALKKS